MRDRYRVNAVRENEDIVVESATTLVNAIKFTKKSRANELLKKGYSLQVYRDHPSLVHEVRPSRGH